MPSEITTEFYYEEQTAFRKTSFDNGTWIFEVERENGNNIPSWVSAEFMESDKFNEKLMLFLLLVGCPYHLLFLGLDVIYILIVT